MPLSLIQPLHSTPLAIVDVETTGASADYGDRIIEIGVARVENGKIVATLERLINPNRRISAGVTALTGISQAMVQDQPSFDQAAADVLALLQGAVVIGHNVRFDLSFLLREFARIGVDLPQTLDNAPVLDTVRIARRRFGRGGNGLQRLCLRLGYQPQVAHRALADVVTTWEVLQRMLEPAGGLALSLADIMLMQGGPMGLLPATPRQSLLPLELEEALEQRGIVMMEYVDANQSTTRRVVQPLEIRRFRGELVLIAHCQLRDARRNFKVERIVRLERIDAQNAPGGM